MGFVCIEALIFLCSLGFWRMAIYWTWAIITSNLQLLLNLCPSYPRVRPSTSFQPVCVITGASSGLGAAAARHLSKEGFFVVLAGRSLQRLEKTIQEIKQDQHGAHLKAFHLDLESFNSIADFKASLEEWLISFQQSSSIQLLINNAGVLSTSHITSSDGFDRMMEINYIGAFALTQCLLSLLGRSPVPSRVVQVTSFTHRCVSHIKVDKEELSKRKPRFSIGLNSYPFAQVYEYSKFCLLLFSYELNRKLQMMNSSWRISVMAADPGIVETKLLRNIPLVLTQPAFKILKLFGLIQTPKIGVNSIIDAALAPEGLSGLYFFGGKGRTIKSNKHSYDLKLSQELWNNSLSLLSESKIKVLDCVPTS